MTWGLQIAAVVKCVNQGCVPQFATLSLNTADKKEAHCRHQLSQSQPCAHSLCCVWCAAVAANDLCVCSSSSTHRPCSCRLGCIHDGVYVEVALQGRRWPLTQHNTHITHYTSHAHSTGVDFSVLCKNEVHFRAPAHSTACGSTEGDISNTRQLQLQHAHGPLCSAAAELAESQLLLVSTYCIKPQTAPASVFSPCAVLLQPLQQA